MANNNLADIKMHCLLFWYHGERKWSIQNMNTIVKPRREYEEYKEGELVLARFQGNAYRAAIIRIKENRGDLEDDAKYLEAILDDPGIIAKLEMQKMGLSTDQNMLPSAENRGDLEDDAKYLEAILDDPAIIVKLEMQKMGLSTDQHMLPNADTAHPIQNGKEWCDDITKPAQRQLQKKELDKKKLAASVLQFNEIINQRGQEHLGKVETGDRTAVESTQETPIAVESTRGETPIAVETKQDETIKTKQPQTTRDDYLRSYATSAFKPYNPYSHRISTTLRRRSTHREEIAFLKEKNRRLQEENSALRLELQKKDNGTCSCGMVASPNIIGFLRNLTTTLERNQEKNIASARSMDFYQSPEDTPGQVIRPSPVILRPQTDATDTPRSRRDVKDTLMSRADVTGRSQTDVTETLRSRADARETPPRHQHALGVDGFHKETPDVQLKEEWAKSETMTGMPKVKLVTDVDVFLTSVQLSEAIRKAVGQPRLLIITLLEVFFDRQTMAQSSCKGARRAVNKKSTWDSQRLPADVVCAIKLFVLRHFKKPDGEACLSDAIMNAVINSKCATSRRSLSK